MRYLVHVALASIVACTHVAKPVAPPPAAPAPAPPAAPEAVGRARVNLRVDRADKLLLGENVLVHFCLENTSTEAITIDVGGDYRAASRSLRFKTTMTDAQGATLDDPDPAHFSMGGIGYAPTIAPRASWCQSLPLVHYARINEPGTYTVRVVHDLGWPEGTAPGGEIRVTFAMPSAAEAEGVITTMEAQPDHPNSSAGAIAIPYRDLTCLRYPVYLEPLARRARGGNVEAIAGLGQIPNVEATRVLLGLLEHARSDIAEAAGSALAMRLPDPALDGALGPRNPFFNELNEPRRYLSKVGWRPELVADVRAAATKLLARDDDASASRGAFFLEAVGEARDNTMLLDAFTRAIARTATTPRETQVAPTPRGACQELARAAEILLGRGAVVAEPPRSNGEIAEWLIALRKGARPAGWESTLTRALESTNGHVRRLALEAMPEPVPPAFMKHIDAALTSSDVDVQVAAVAIVQRSKLTTLGRSTAAILVKATDSWLMSTAWSTAVGVGARGAAVDALIGRLSDPPVASEALGHLVELFEQNGRSSSGPVSFEDGPALVARWRSFVAKNRARIEKKERMSLDDPSIPHDLVPKTWRITRQGKPDWPPLP